MSDTTTEPSETATRTERKRSAIMEAARAAFREHGFDRASMDAIAARAEVSKRTVYNHFASKDVLFEAVLQELLERVEHDHPLVYSPTEPLATQLESFARAKLSSELEPDFIGLVRAMIADIARSPGLGTAALTGLMTREDGLQKWLRAAHADGRLRVPYPHVAAHQFWALVKGAAFWPVLSGLCTELPKPLLDKAVQESVAMLLDHYRVRRED